MIALNHHVRQHWVPSPITIADVSTAAVQIISICHSSFLIFMEPAKLLTSGLTLEESRAKRQEKQAARYRHRLGYVSTSWIFGFFVAGFVVL